MKKILVVGLGYVGLSFALLLAKQNEVFALDINEDKIAMLKNGISPLKTEEFVNALNENTFNKIHFSTKMDDIIDDIDYVLIATPTDYDETKDCFNVSSVSSVIEQVKKYKSAKIIIKSTVPVGFTSSFNMDNLYFSPEFLREDKAIFDILNPSRIIIGGKEDNDIKDLFLSLSNSKDVEVLFTTSSEAEAIKLFSNAYLAMRVAFFNEIDTFSLEKGLDTNKVIKGISLDNRIGNYYNNPSFGYGGYCLPKDTKQLRSNFKDIPSSMIGAIIDANEVRKDYIVNLVSKCDNVKTIGIYRLSMKKGSDNFRNSSINDIIDKLVLEKYNIVIYEPLLKEKQYKGLDVILDFEEFKKSSDIILANRYDIELDKVKEKVISRDLFSRD